MGIDEDAIQNMSEELGGLMDSGLVEIEGDETENGKVPTLNLGEIFGMPMKEDSDSAERTEKKRDSKK